MARYIDGDKLIQENLEIIDCDVNHPKYEDTLRDIIDNAPTEDVAPVIHAKWGRMSESSVEEDDRWKCSRCGNVIHAKSKMDLITFFGWDSRC